MDQHPLRRKALYLFILLAMILLGIGSPARAESESPFEELNLEHYFGDQIIIWGQIKPEIQFQDMQVTIQSEDDTIIASDPVLEWDDREFAFSLDVRQNPVRTFTELTIRFEITLTNGEQLSFDMPYYYDDNRYVWKELHTEEFSIYWNQNDDALGERILNIAYDGLQRIESRVSVPKPDEIKIYAYENVLAMQETLTFAGQTAAWVAGHADTDLGVIIVSLPPGPDQLLEIKRQIPHEIMHVLLFQKLGAGYYNLPQWLIEGLASSVELFPNPDYQILLDKAYERETLLPISDLCHSFPLDAANFQLSYAESTAFTWYLQQIYGNAKMEALIQAYADGMGCEQGPESPLGSTLTELENDWRQAMFNENPALNAVLFVSPWLIIFAVAFITPFGFILGGIRKKKNGNHKPA